MLPVRSKKYEDYAYVLDFMQFGRSSLERPRHVAVPTVQVIGESYFTLLEAELKPGATVEPQERIYIGRDRREKVNRIVSRINYDGLTATAKAEILPVLEQLIQINEGRFVDFFNKAQPVTPRMHALELLPGIGKKSMWQVVDQREKQPFESFRDIGKRTNVSDPGKIIARRILEELSEDAKYRLFSRAA